MATSASVQIKGLNKCVRQLQKMGVEVTDLKAAFRKVADLVTGDARALIHSRTGALASNIRSAKQKNKARVMAGSKRVPYAGVINYGNYNNIQPQQYLQRAAESNMDQSVSIIDREIRGLIRKLNL